MLERLARLGEVFIGILVLAAGGFMVLVAYWLYCSVNATGGIVPQNHVDYVVATMFELCGVFLCVPVALRFIVPGRDPDD